MASSLRLALPAGEFRAGFLGIDHFAAPQAFAAAGSGEERGFSVDQIAQIPLESIDVSRGEVAASLENVLRGALPLGDAYFDPPPFSVVGVPGALDSDLDGHSSTSFKLPVRYPSRSMVT